MAEVDHTSPRSIANLRTIFLGTTGATSAAVLETLLAAGADIRALVIGGRGGAGEAVAALTSPRAASLVPIANPFVEHNAIHIAWERALPVFELRRPGAPEAQALLRELRPDVACVACFPHRIPVPLLAAAPLGFLNMHPALLPAHRGPEPLFWSFRAGDPAGVTIHAMDETLDTGDSVAQAPLDLPDGIAGAQAEHLAAELGGRLMVAALRDLAAGTLVRRPQPPGGSYESWPMPEDFRLASDWPARRAFNFMRATAAWGQPYRIELGGAELALHEAIAYQANGMLPAPYARAGASVQIQLAPGILIATEIRDPDA
jgi:methionyl-tRNA formyltransferase